MFRSWFNSNSNSRFLAFAEIDIDDVKICLRLENHNPKFRGEVTLPLDATFYDLENKLLSLVYNLEVKFHGTRCINLVGPMLKPYRHGDLVAVALSNSLVTIVVNGSTDISIYVFVPRIVSITMLKPICGVALKPEICFVEHHKVVVSDEGKLTAYKFPQFDEPKYAWFTIDPNLDLRSGLPFASSIQHAVDYGTLVSNNKEYTPTMDDVGKRLCLMVVPPTVYHSRFARGFTAYYCGGKTHINENEFVDANIDFDIVSAPKVDC